MSKTSAVEKAEVRQPFIVRVVDYVKGLLELGKFRLSLSVAFSALASYFIVADVVSWQEVAILGIGGLILAMSANALNQYLERDIDAIMERTSDRPLVTGMINSIAALSFVGIGFVVSILLLGWLCWCAALLGVVAWVAYIAGYTVLKRKTPRAVELGSLSGALPAAIGALVAVPQNWIVATLLFIVQFIWQYPHTWIILKLYEDQYALIGTKIRAPKRFNWALLITSILPPLIMIPVGLMVGINWLIVTVVTLVFIGWVVKSWITFRKNQSERTLRKFLVVNLLMLPLHYSVFILLKFLEL